MSLHGWLVIDKPAGITSAQVVARVKRLLQNLPLPLREGLGEGCYPPPNPPPQGGRAFRIGHAGTLDPFATGVLPLALGEATKTAGYGLEQTKSYQFELTFGTATDTEDCTGQTIETHAKRPSLAEIEAILPQFRGEILQVPPIYSAIHVGGKRAYALARAGEMPEMEARKITIYSLGCHTGEGRYPISTDIKMDSGLRRNDEVVGEATFNVTCSKGTYIRSLARDMARALGTVGHVSALRRLKSGVFSLTQAISLETLEKSAREGAASGHLLPPHAVLDDILVLPVNAAQATELRQGKAIFCEATTPAETLFQARNGDDLVALGTCREGRFTSKRVFNPI